MNGIWYDTEWKFRRDANATADWWQWGSFETLAKAKREINKELSSRGTAFERGRIVKSTPNIGRDKLIHGCKLDIVFETTAREAAK